MGIEGIDEDGAARPALWCPLPAPARAVEDRAVPTTEVSRDGAVWPVATPADVAWIVEGTTADSTITTAVPTGFAAYATVVLPEAAEQQQPHDEALLSVLREHGTRADWWLGYLETGADDVVFPLASRVSLYWQWPYVVVRAGPEQAASWRAWEIGSFWRGHLPNLMFAADHSWIVSTLWDDDWTCVGGRVDLVEALLRHPALGSRSRRVLPGEQARPPGFGES